MGLTRTGDVAIAILVFWVPAFFLALYVCSRHGFKRQSGWLMILLLATCRVISGASTVAYQAGPQPPNESVVACAIITGALGISFVLSALAGVLMRVFDDMKRETMINARLVRVLYLAITVAIILSIVAGTKLGGSSSDRNTAINLQKASTVIYVVVFLVISGMVVLAITNLRYILESERRLFYAVALAIPFTAVRLLYSLIAVFGHSRYFSIYSPFVWTEAFMQVLMEMIVAVILLCAGLITEPRSKQISPPAYDMEQVNDGPRK